MSKEAVKQVWELLAIIVVAFGFIAIVMFVYNKHDCEIYHEMTKRQTVVQGLTCYVQMPDSSWIPRDEYRTVLRYEAGK